MSQSVPRAVMIAIGVSLLIVYVAAAALVYELLTLLIRSPPNLATALVMVGTITVLAAYLSYRFGTQQLLAGLDAVEIDRRHAPEFFGRLERLRSSMEIERPRVAVARLGVPNAFALGGVSSGVIVFDLSLFRMLTPDEREAILAHELSHLENYDAFVQTVAYSALRTLVGLMMIPLLPLLLAITGIAHGWAWIRGRPDSWSRNPLMLVYHWASLGVTLLAVGLTILIRAHSRRRELAADDRAVEVTGKPLALARALRKIQRAGERERGLLATLYVQGDEDGLLTRLLSTHPPMDDRIDRLLDRAGADTLGGRRIPIE
ncbi:M48 family metallopeptidase [Halapricum hydrolyticum]|uniref:M48 family metalloprotease n=1 Tax=Halapricum hydrolyticum TaxID=2979991 RepID=A0AAE3IB75_9EURY|nr:M48 family metalloprotease [Halapricum hydrolyticum]MCU4717037.1 M48 family metalloprotease [Halapricum hydrolyticum]MCU4725963.1 M48 family metalloprotease [Halapricum hydrolyticum]